MPATERVLTGIDDGFRVRSDVTDEGILLFEFPEVRHRQRLGFPEDPPPPLAQESRGVIPRAPGMAKHSGCPQVTQGLTFGRT